LLSSRPRRGLTYSYVYVVYAEAKNFRRGGCSNLGLRIIARIDHRDFPCPFVHPRYSHQLIFHVAFFVYQPERPKLALREYNTARRTTNLCQPVDSAWLRFQLVLNLFKQWSHQYEIMIFTIAITRSSDPSEHGCRQPATG